MSAQDCEQLTLFPADSPASPFPWLESKKERKTIVTSGRQCCELSESCARVALSVRTYLESSRLPPGKWSRIWSVQAITSSCLILKLRLSERGTGDQGCSSSESPKMWKTPVAADAANRKMYVNSRGEPNLSGQVKLYPTPKASDSKGSGPAGSKSAEHDLARGNLRGVLLYATPCARDYRTGQRERYDNPARANNLNDQIAGQLNPTWVEWLMGFPIGWTELNVSETP